MDEKLKGGKVVVLPCAGVKGINPEAMAAELIERFSPPSPSRAIKEMFDAELAENASHPCPRCGGPTYGGYPGNDPENGPAHRRCRDAECQAEHELEEMETVYVVVSSNACTGCVDGVDVTACADLTSAAEVVSDVIGTWVDPDTLTGEDLFMHHGDGWRVVTDDAPNDRGYTPEWVQVSKRRVR